MRRQLASLFGGESACVVATIFYKQPAPFRYLFASIPLVPADRKSRRKKAARFAGA